MKILSSSTASQCSYGITNTLAQGTSHITSKQMKMWCWWGKGEKCGVHHIMFTFGKHISCNYRVNLMYSYFTGSRDKLWFPQDWAQVPCGVPVPQGSTHSNIVWVSCSVNTNYLFCTRWLRQHCSRRKHWQ